MTDNYPKYRDCAEEDEEKEEDKEGEEDEEEYDIKDFAHCPQVRSTKLRYNLCEEISRKNLCNCCNGQDNLINIDCGHKHCQKCFTKLVQDVFYSVSVYQNFDPSFLSFPCRACYTPISERIVRANFRDYNENIGYLQQKKRYQCPCGVIGTIEMFVIGCRDQCNTCALKYLRYNYNYCWKCNNLYNEEVLAKLKGLTKKCDGCKRSLQELKFFRGIFCDHNFCSSCLKKCFTRQQCIVSCGTAGYSIEDSRLYTQSQCSLCNQYYDDCNDFDTTKDCECNICTQCQIGSSKAACAVCTLELPPRAVYSLENYEYNIKIRLRQCPICTNSFDLDLMVAMEQCEDQSCIDCTQKYMKANLDSQTFSQCLNCPQCSKELSTNQLEKIVKSIGEEYWDKLNFFLIQREFSLLQCPKCMNQFIPADSRLARCANLNCNYVFCKVCMEAYHEQGSCQDIIIDNSLKVMEEAYAAEEICQCPGCRFPYLKDPACGHVTCMEINCKTVFCFYCGCLRSPYYAHGAHYHRPSCRLYKEYNGKEEVQQDCSECQRVGGLCPRPANLKTPCRVQADEVIKN